MSKCEIYKDNIDNTLFPPYGLTAEDDKDTEISHLPPAFRLLAQLLFEVGLTVWGAGREKHRSCHGDQTRTWRVGAGRGNAAAADWLGSHSVAQSPKDSCLRRPIAFLAESCGAICPGICVWLFAGSRSANPRAELPVIVDRRAVLIPAWPRVLALPPRPEPSARQARGGAASLRVQPFAHPGRSRRGCAAGWVPACGADRSAATRAPRTGRGRSAAVGRPSPAVSTVGTRRATDRRSREEPVPPVGEEEGAPERWIHSLGHVREGAGLSLEPLEPALEEIAGDIFPGQGRLPFDLSSQSYSSLKDLK
ncbi:uncharacterized protein LOC123779748 [Ursus americanus]|uniref:uncharacterized protein LOC123779748 n=1 Tax=Ursus americanus TaxID=9643 RepID=UPI001E67C7DB|nr:uncharacterized protein LOC123779748 [Ursus americanus]